MVRSIGVIGLFLCCFALPVTLIAHAEENAIPPLRDKRQLLFWYLAQPLIDGEPSPIESLPGDRPFKAVRFNVLGFEEEDQLAAFAQTVLRSRLQELGVADRLHILMPVNPGTEGPWPTGVLSCDILRVTVVFRTARDKIDSEDVAALTAAFFGTQESVENDSGTSRCLNRNIAPPQVLDSLPRTILIRRANDDAILEQAKSQIVELIDQQIVLKIITTNATAKATVEAWSKSTE